MQNHIDIWIHSLRQTPYLPHLFLSLLNEAESKRCREFRREEDRFRFVFSRILLRCALSTTSGIDPRRWEFERDSSGEWVLSRGKSVCRFSLSHTDSVIAVATSHHGRIGIDVEPEASSLASAIDAFSSEEIRWLEGLSPSCRKEEALSMWTVKEAYAKFTGVGAELDFSEISTIPTLPSGCSLHTETLVLNEERYRMSVVFAESRWKTPVEIHLVDTNDLEAFVG